MTRPPHLKTTLFAATLFTFLGLASPAWAGSLVPWSSPEGMSRLARSYKSDFFLLANHYQAQTDQMECGVVSAVIVMNASRWNTDKAPFIELPSELTKFLPKNYEARVRGYQPETFFTPAVEQLAKKDRASVYGKPLAGKTDFGIPLEPLAQMIRAYGFQVEVQHAESAKQESMTRTLIDNMKKSGNYAIVNYTRKAIGQEGGGHFSPLAAYDPLSHSFLILDVNPTRAPWVWVEQNDLFNAMNTADGDAHRGFLQITEGTTPRAK